MKIIFIKTKIASFDLSIKISIILGILAHSILWINFLVFPILEKLDEIFSKPYISMPIAIILAWFISDYFHKKNKPNQSHFIDNRKDVLADLFTYIGQAKDNIFLLYNYKDPRIQKDSEYSLINNNFPSINNILKLFNSYLKVKEIRKSIIFVNECNRIIYYNNKNNSIDLLYAIDGMEGFIISLIEYSGYDNEKSITRLLKPITDKEDRGITNTRKLCIEKLNEKYGFNIKI